MAENFGCRFLFGICVPSNGILLMTAGSVVIVAGVGRQKTEEWQVTIKH